jgi:hypothetical protein
MSQKKYKKRRAQSSANVKRRVEDARIADEKERSKNRMDPIARILLLGDVVMLVACQMLYNGGLISDLLANGITLLGLFLLCLALWFQFGGGNQRNGRGLR